MQAQLLKLFYHNAARERQMRLVLAAQPACAMSLVKEASPVAAAVAAGASQFPYWSSNSRFASSFSGYRSSQHLLCYPAYHYSF